MAGNRASDQAKSHEAFGDALKPAEMFLGGISALAAGAVPHGGCPEGHG